jgi:hypothetical protein
MPWVTAEQYIATQCNPSSTLGKIPSKPFILLLKQVGIRLIGDVFYLEKLEKYRYISPPEQE